MQITWISCAEKMPPDDDTKIILLYAGSHPTVITGKWFKSYQTRRAMYEPKWTKYTQEKWEALNK